MFLGTNPFIDYFASNVLTKLNAKYNNSDVLTEFNKLLTNGEITGKEKDLFYFMLQVRCNG